MGQFRWGCLFGGESLFDLIDRPFDYAEPGVERIMALSKLLSRGQVETSLLSFPSSGHTAPLSCRCTIHTLADGRAGLLVIAAGYRESDSEIPFEKLAQAFDLLPAAAAFMGQDGSLHRLNAAALLLLGADQRASLSALIENSPHADDLLARLSSTGTVSDVKRLRTKIGQRDIRLTLRKLGIAADNVAFAMVLLDDITERRALERNISTSALGFEKNITTAPQFAPAEAEAFHHLGKMLNESTIVLEPASKAVPEKPRRKQAAIPFPVTNAIDKLANAVLIVKDGNVLYANSKAREMFGYGSVEDVINDETLWEFFAALAQPTAGTTLTLENGREISFTMQSSAVAWQSGPARQFILQPVAAPALKRNNVEVVPSHAPVATVEEPPAIPHE